MKVLCSKLEIPRYKKWLTEGHEYIVLSIFVENQKIRYRLIGNDGEIPAIYDSHLFTMVSSHIPNNWIINFDNDDFELTPEPWTQPDFWENYFDNEKNARQIFENERRKIMASEEKQIWDQHNTLEEGKFCGSDNSVWLTEWYSKQCMSDWEQGNGIQIGTLETPGWFVKVNLKKTGLENKRFDVVDNEFSATDWIFCSVNNGLFEGFCGPENLPKLLTIFRNWVESKT